MNFTLIGSLMLAGLLGSGHCLAMCGGIQASLGRRALPGDGSAAWLQLGRVFGYAVLGGVASLLGTAIFGYLSLAPVVRPLWIAANLLAVATGLTLLIYARQPRWLDALGDRFAGWIGAPYSSPVPSPVGAGANPTSDKRVAVGASPGWSVLQFHPRNPPASSRLARAARLTLTGAAWALLPCGFLYSAVLLVLVGADPLTGATGMAGFALATAVPLMLAHRLGQASARHPGDPQAGRRGSLPDGSMPGGSLRSGSSSGLWDWFDRYLGARALGALITLTSVYGIYMIASGHADRLFCRT